VPGWLRWGGPAVLAVALLLHLAVYLHWPAYALQIDVLVYRFGGLRVLNGLDLYSIGRNGASDDLLFTYTPFAALLFVPLAFVTDHAAQVLSMTGAALLLVYVVHMALRYLGVSRRDGLWNLTALLVGLLSWLEPIRMSVQLGQINLLILALVVADMLAPQRRRWAGIGIGLAAGIKLTPAIFIIYLILLKRWRAACIASATLLATVLVGFVVLPTDSRFYWFGRAFNNLSRISKTPEDSTSLRGLFVRLHYPTELATVLAVVVACVSLGIAVIAYRRGHAVLGVALVGMASAAASPFSWSHHWVWFAPLGVHLGYRAYILRSRASAWTLWLFCVGFAAWFTSLEGLTPDVGALKLRPGGIWDRIIPSVYVFVLLVAMVVTAIWLRRQSTVEPMATEGEGHRTDLSHAAVPAADGLK
jgi:alpha-1,2-mannosyltransferase